MRVGVNWYLNYFCNYNCSYCYARPIYKELWGKLEYTSETVNLLLKSFKESPIPLDVTLLGGEPTKDINFSKIVNFLGELSDSTTTISSNGSLSEKTLSKLKHSKNISFSLSYHPEDCSPQEFISKAVAVRSSGFPTFPQILLHHNKKFWGNIEETFNGLKLENFKVSVDFLKDFKKEFKYSADFWEWCRKFIESDETYTGAKGNSDFYNISKEKCNSFKGWYCWNNVVIISPRGDISQACSNVSLGNISDNPRFFESCEILEPQMCCKDVCPCKEWLNFKKQKEVSNGCKIR